MKPGKSKNAGFTIIAMLVATAVIGLGLAATGTVWSQARQRDREAELLAVGAEFRTAIERYYQRTPGVVKNYPQTLDELVKDPRFPGVERHLRRLYKDPMTGAADWLVVEAPTGGIMGVRSRSEAAPLKTGNFGAIDPGAGATRYSDWRFVYEPPR